MARETTARREPQAAACTLVWASVGVIVIGIIVGWIMAKAGYGVNGPKYSPKAH